MKAINYILLIIILNLGFIFSKDYAYPMENDKRQMGIFQPAVYGIKNNVEVSTHPILFLLKPNIRVKKFYNEINGFGLASRYTFDYPTPLLIILQKDGTGGFLAEDPEVDDIPHLLVLQGELLATKSIANYSLTTKLGMSTCLGCDLDSRHLIDYDLAYPRMALYYYGIGANMGLDLDYLYSDKISMKADMDLLFLPEEHTFIEHKFLFHYEFSSKYTLSGGYKFSYGYYPFNEKEGLWNLFPLLDIRWQWEK